MVKAYCLSAVFLVGCVDYDPYVELWSTVAQGETCVTTCGAHAYGVLSCSELQTAEDAAVRAYAEVGDACAALKTTWLGMRSGSEAGWFTDGTTPARGYFDPKTTAIMLSRVPIVSGSYAHEVGHLIQFTTGHYEPCHEGWASGPIESAMRKFYVEMGVPAPELSFPSCGN